ncbi:MAG: rane protein, partial [Pseudonocardia sp.]|nr:rane protein [Pseudonocardia sp.]
SAGLLGMYLRTPGMRQKGSLRPTEQGLALAQDAWMLGIGLGFIVEELNRTDRLVGTSKPAAGTGVACSPR